MYQEWLNALGRHFFGRHQAGLRVRLSINRKFLDEHFADLGGTASFVESMREGPLWANRDIRPTTMRYRGLKLYDLWSDADPYPPDYLKLDSDIEDLPPYLPYLCLLCLAWTEGEEEVHASHAFYHRLELLYPDHDLNGRLRDWCKLWDDLAEWADEKKGGHGIFVVERLGGMPYVGIPKSQVIFTPNRIESLPSLFAALNLQPGTEPSPSKIRTVISANRLVAAHFLGNAVTELICSAIDASIGDAAIAVILEHLANWDGTVPGSESAGGGSGAAQQKRRLTVALEAVDPAGWRMQLAVEGGPETSLIRFLGHGWRLEPANSLFALVTERGGQILDAKILLSELAGSETYRGAYVPEVGAETEISFSLQERRARYFDRWYDARLIECDQLPPTGTSYVLLTREGYAEWESWYPEFGGNIQKQDYTENGLPRGWHLIYIDGLGALDEVARQRFPGYDESARRKTTAIWLSSGTRIQSSVSRRLYAQYDPPLVHVNAKPDAVLLTPGANSVETAPAIGRARKMPGSVVKTYSLTVESGEDVVVLQVYEKNEVIAQTSFGVWAERALSEVQAAGLLQIDRFGNIEAQAGVLGTKCPLAAEREPAGEFGPVTDCAEVETETALLSPTFNLLESLSTKTRFAFPEYRRRAVEIAKVDYWTLYQETRWLAYLSHIDIQADSKGRWSHVIPLGRQLMLSPVRCGRRYQALVSGCGTKAQLHRLLKAATELEIEVHASAAGCMIAPPRIMLRHESIEAFELAADAAKIEWVAGCAPYSIAKWSASLDEWDRGPISWYNHEPPNHESEYTPYRYQVVPCAEGVGYASPTRLFTVADPYAAGHRWHVLVRTNSILEPDTGKQRYAFIGDPSWAMWKTHLSIADEDSEEPYSSDTIIPYHPETGSVIVPRNLNFPYLLGRALCTSSGLAPKRVGNVPVYSQRALGIIPKASPHYSGDCWEYRGVPRRIAEVVASKLSARLKDV